jgi:hypothetical protein
MIGHREFETEQMDHRADQSLGLPKAQPEDRPQGQRLRVSPLTTPAGAWLSSPGRNRFVSYPKSKAAALTQRRIIFRPIGDTLELARNMVSSGGVGFEGHLRHPEPRVGDDPYPADQPSASRQRSMQQDAPWEREFDPIEGFILHEARAGTEVKSS